MKNIYRFTDFLIRALTCLLLFDVPRQGTHAFFPFDILDVYKGSILERVPFTHAHCRMKCLVLLVATFVAVSGKILCHLTFILMVVLIVADVPCKCVNNHNELL